MAIATIQIGQCGNQIGHAFFDTIFNEIGPQSVYNTLQGENPSFLSERVIETFFQREFASKSLSANAVLVDMEPKVVQRCLLATQNQQWRYAPALAYSKQSGSGNNWALGYQSYSEEEYMSTHSCIQKLLEKMDYFGGFQVLQSLAGGTGSGLGAHVVEKVRDDFSKVNMLTFSVWPYSTGEVILQNYNVLLTLNSLLQESHGVVPIQNDEVLSICRESLKLDRPSYKCMNGVIAQQLASVLFPCADTSKEKVSLWGGPIVINDLVNNLCCDPRYKLLTIKSIPQCPQVARDFNSDLWEGMVLRMRQMLAANCPEHKINWNQKVENPKAKVNKSTGTMLFIRGDGVYSKEVRHLDQAPFSYPHLYSNNSPNYCSYRDSHRLFGHEKSLGCISNCQSVVPVLERTLRSATMMLQEGAYLHQYAKFGVGKEVFEEAMVTCENALAEYKAI